MAAINFPSSPVLGQTYEYGDYLYTFDGVKWTSTVIYGSSAVKIQSSTPPEAPEAGLQWYDNTSGRAYFWHVNEGTASGQWVEDAPQGVVEREVDYNLQAVARANDVRDGDVSYLELAYVSGVSYLFKANNQATYISKLPLTGAITDIGTEVDGVLDIMLDGVTVSLVRSYRDHGLGRMGYTHTADAVFTGSDNKIIMTGLVTSLGLEVGDVLLVGNADPINNKPRTVDSIINDNTVIVNYEHCGDRGNGSLKLVDETVVGADIKLLSKWNVAPIGQGQANVSVPVTASTVDKPNNSKRPISVNVIGTSTSYEISGFVDGLLVGRTTTGGSTGTSFSFIHTPGSTYKLVYSAGLQAVTEVR